MLTRSCVWVLAAALGARCFAYEKEIRNMAATMAESIARSAKKTIAVVDFTDLQGNVTELGRFLAEEFSVALAGTGKGFEVVDRTHLKAILAEHKLASTGVIDPATARKLGQIAGVEALVTGTITPFGDSVRLAVKGLDTVTAKIILAAATDIPKTKAIEELLAKGIQEASAAGVSQPVRSAEPRRQSTGPDTAGSQMKKAAGLTFQPGACSRRGERVSCSVLITNVSDKPVRAELACPCGAPASVLARAATMVDEWGNTYFPSQVFFAGRSWTKQEKETERCSCVHQDLVTFHPGIPGQAAFVYEGVDSTAKFASVVQRLTDERGQDFVVSVEKIPIQ